MSARRNQLKVVLCAALTTDGKLDEPASLALARTLLQGGGSSGRHPWAVHFDRASAVLLDQRLVVEPALTRAAARPRLVFASAQTLELELGRLRLARLGGRAWCFGGAGLFRALLETGSVDELFLWVHPRIDGRRGAATLSGVSGAFFPASVACRLVKMEVAGDECFLRYRVRRAEPAAHPAT